MNESGFNLRRSSDEVNFRQSVGSKGGRYLFFKVRRYGRLHFEKMIAPDYLDDVVTEEAHRKEFEIGYGLDHPGIVKYLAYEGCSIYEEYIDGLNLREMIEKGDPRLQDRDFLKKICRSVLEALGYMHRKGILHLDVKPENVMMCNIGDGVKLVDLGSARSAIFDNTEGFTPQYMAPEQGGNFSTDVRTDLFLVGKLMAELVRGSEFEDEWKDFVRVATAPDPNNRFASAEEALKRIPDKDRLPPPVPPKEEKLLPSRVSDSEKRKRKIGWILPVIFVFLIVGAIIWGIAKKSSGGSGSGGVIETQDTGISNNSDEASPEFKQAAALLKGTGVKQDEAEGMRLMMLAAEKGDAMAQCYIGLMYRDGCATLRADAAKSFIWIKKAAEQGNEVAIEEMGYKYYEGLGVEQNYGEAMKWLKLAAEKGKTSAYSSVGIMYRDGEGVEKDFSKAEEYFLKGAIAGNSYSAYLLGRLYGHYMNPPQVEKSLQWYQKASDMGSYRATEFLKTAYSEGDSRLGISPDSLLAVKYSVRLESSEAN
ncbi:MAG: protein kinase [Muribaculaceae bacterium]|nr:protein kinase [Muribaculaceae bacterium]